MNRFALMVSLELYQEKHMTICEKQRNKQRKIFDSSKQRAVRDEKGDLIQAPQVPPSTGSKKTRKSKGNASATAASVNERDSGTKSRKSNWREAHEEFIRTVRQARGEVVQEEPEAVKRIPAGYVQCECCGRNFSKAAAERHIPWCKEQKSRAPLPRSPASGDAMSRFKARAKYKAPSLRKSSSDSLDRISRDGSINGNLSANTNGKIVENSKPIGKKNGDVTTDLKNGKPKPMAGKEKKTTKESRMDPLRHKSPGRKDNNTTSKVKLRIQENRSKQHPKTPVMKFKEKFPNHSMSDESITSKMLQNNESLKEMLKRPDDSFSSTLVPKTVPGVRTRGLSPIRNDRSMSTDNINKSSFDQMKQRLDEMYYSRAFPTQRLAN